jgi:hypothetical protein
MDRVFHDEDNILETVQVQVKPQTTQTGANIPHPPGLTWPQVSLVALGLIAVLGSSGLAVHWKLTQQALEREGTLALIERLRKNQSAATGDAQSGQTPEPSSAVVGSSETAATADQPDSNALPDTATTLEPLTVPLSAAEDATIAPLPDQASAFTAQPVLVGVVHGGDGDGAAIFQIGGLSLSTVPGEVIGNSGWTLRSLSANGAVIERAGATQSLSIGGAF